MAGLATSGRQQRAQCNQEFGPATNHGRRLNDEGCECPTDEQSFNRQCRLVRVRKKSGEVNRRSCRHECLAPDRRLRWRWSRSRRGRRWRRHRGHRTRRRETVAGRRATRQCGFISRKSWRISRQGGSVPRQAWILLWQRRIKSRQAGSSARKTRCIAGKSRCGSRQTGRSLRNLRRNPRLIRWSARNRRRFARKPGVGRHRCTRWRRVGKPVVEPIGESRHPVC